MARKKNITDFAPTGDLADFKLGDGAAGTDQPVELEAGGSAVNILGRDKNQTKGGFATKIKDVKLVVANANDAGAAGHEFAGQVIWSLNDTP
ncbi:hypothetical protein [Enterococcus rivorum]|uniref:hypothetical protein n=1 Tax=Enterococcus rivorum TaxID=762845 RepID=UPI003627D4AE